MNLNQYLEQKIERWKKLLNEGYKTDSGRDVCEFAKGQMMAYLEILNYIKKHEK
jgi:hypothetical protein